jgi:hypothetical protein
MRSVRVALALGGTLLALALALTLAGSPASLAGTNGIREGAEVARTGRATSACQVGEVLPAGTSAVRLTLAAEIGPTVAVAASSGGRTITRGARGGGWTGASVTVPVQPVSRTVSGATLCFALGRPLEDVAIFGEKSPGANALSGPRGERLPGRIAVEYLRPGRASWLSQLSAIARRMGFGHAWGGAWIAFALLIAMASAVGLLAWVALGELRAGEPR